MYLLNINDNITGSSTYIIDSLINFEKHDFWHFRLEHVGINAMNIMMNHDLILNKSKTYSMKNCECCAQSKLTKIAFKSVERSTSLLELIHTDL